VHQIAERTHLLVIEKHSVKL